MDRFEKPPLYVLHADGTITPVPEPDGQRVTLAVRACIELGAADDAIVAAAIKATGGWLSPHVVRAVLARERGQMAHRRAMP